MEQMADGAMAQEPNAASVALIDGERVLLVQRAFPPYRNLWTLPGGRREAGESAEECAAREVQEELGLRVYGLRHLETQNLSAATGNWRLAVFATEGFEGEITPSAEIADHRWVGLDMVGGMRTTTRLIDVLQRAFRLFDRT
jgi:8-oxo-dGTP diphosphatase